VYFVVAHSRADFPLPTRQCRSLRRVARSAAYARAFLERAPGLKPATSGVTGVRQPFHRVAPSPKPSLVPFLALPFDPS
jgi:hypothetical protein